MKKVYLILFVQSFALAAAAQQEATFSQFMYNKLAYNPGYAGSFESPTLTIHDRHQWVGFDGALNSQRIDYTQPALNRRVGLGAAMSRVEIGITRTITFEASYAYRVAFRRGYLGIGLQAGMRHFLQNWNDPRLEATQGNDNAIPPGAVNNKFLPNFGVGVFYTGYKFYAGLAVPRLLKNNIDFSDIDEKISEEVPHLNAMAGIDFKPADDIKLTAQTLLRYVKGAPFDADFNLTAGFKGKFYTGATYRTGGDGLGESFVPSLGIQATDKLFFNLSYDLALSRLRTQQAGTFEVSLRWWFSPPAAGGTTTTAPPVF